MKFHDFGGTPFVGLRPFKTEESLLFFGRDQQVNEVLIKLHQSHFVAVVGNSGCGKSSLIYAGVIPQLLAGFLVAERDRWLIPVMKPGTSPLVNLAKALLSTVTPNPTLKSIESFVEERKKKYDRIIKNN